MRRPVLHHRKPMYIKGIACGLGHHVRLRGCFYARCESNLDCERCMPFTRNLRRDRMADVGGSPLTRLCGLLNLLAAACLAVAILLYGIVKTRPSHHKHGPRESSSRHHVDPFIGTAGVGHTSPGAHLPFGKVTLAPLTTGPLLLLTESPGEYSCIAAGYQRGDRR